MIRKTVTTIAVRGLAIGAGIGAAIAVFGIWVATSNYAGLLFLIPGMLLAGVTGVGGGDLFGPLSKIEESDVLPGRESNRLYC